MNTLKTLVRLHRQASMDAVILATALTPADQQRFLNSSPRGHYAWIHAVSEMKMPRRILDLGCGFGYRLHAAIQGAQLYERSIDAYGVDIDADHQMLDHARKTLEARYTNLKLTFQKGYLGEWQIPADWDYFDLVMVSAMDTPEAFQASLELAVDVAAPDAVILVDELSCIPILQRTLAFIRQRQIPSLLLPSAHGMAVLHLPSR